MQTLFFILVGFLAVLALLVLIASRKPDTFRIERRADIKAPPEKLFALIQDFHEWTQWSPWEGMDLAMKRTYSGSERGVGAVYEWSGNDKVGTGRMEIKEVTDNARVFIQLDFLKPWEANNHAEFTLVPSASGATTVTWAMTGPAPITSKVMGMFLNLDKIVGKDFDKGLAKMKAVAEKA